MHCNLTSAWHQACITEQLLTRHQLFFHNPPHWSPPDSSNRVCQWQNVCRSQTCRWSAAACWPQSPQASHSQPSPGEYWLLGWKKVTKIVSVWFSDWIYSFHRSCVVKAFRMKSILWTLCHCLLSCPSLCFFSISSDQKRTTCTIQLKNLAHFF